MSPQFGISSKLDALVGKKADFFVELSLKEPFLLSSFPPNSFPHVNVSSQTISRIICGFSHSRSGVSSSIGP
jgi:hypothetical protein